MPETLHGLIAARLDGLGRTERLLVEDAAVLGKWFHPEALAAVTGTPVTELMEPLAVLVRREILTVTNDPRSPERGQYEFVQDLLQKVAYDTLCRHDAGPAWTGLTASRSSSCCGTEPTATARPSWW